MFASCWSKAFRQGPVCFQLVSSALHNMPDKSEQALSHTGGAWSLLASVADVKKFAGALEFKLRSPVMPQPNVGGLRIRSFGETGEARFYPRQLRLKWDDFGRSDDVDLFEGSEEGLGTVVLGGEFDQSRVAWIEVRNESRPRLWSYSPMALASRGLRLPQYRTS